MSGSGILNIVCVKAGTLYSADYVNRLYAMVARNMAAGTEGRFVCYTEDWQGLRPEIHARPLIVGSNHGWWNKLALFAPGEFSHGDRILYFDLDTVIIGSLDEIAAYEPKQLTLLEDFYRKDRWQSSVMAWKAGYGADIWQEWNRQGRPEVDGGDQAWIEAQVYGADLWQDLFPGKFVSFKRDCIPFPPEGASVVVFHGEPRPHNCGRSWVESMWTESDTGHFQLAMVGNVSLTQIRKQSADSATLDLPRVKWNPPREGKVVIVGGGPSLNDPITLAELQRHKADGAAFWGLNGSYDWLLDHGIIPDAHVILDARLENVRFLDRTKAETTYYIASQCHWVVYDKLRRLGRNVVRFNLDVMGDCGTTVGTHAMAIAHLEGFRETHLYGYDSSYRDDDGHAYLQKVDGADRVIDAHVGERCFKAAPWMVRQAQDFEGLAAALVALGAEITVHGDGLLPYLAYQMQPAHVIRANEVLKRLPPGPVRGTEVGVFRGAMSAELLKRPDLSLVMVDSWEADGAGYVGETGDWHASLTQEEQDACRQEAADAVAFAEGRATQFHARSLTAASSMGDAELDFVFLDADHSYEAVWADLSAWAPTIKDGGLLCGHDYDNPDFPDFGVKDAIDEFAASHGREVELGENLTWFIRL